MKPTLDFKFDGKIGNIQTNAKTRVGYKKFLHKCLDEWLSDSNFSGEFKVTFFNEKEPYGWVKED